MEDPTRGKVSGSASLYTSYVVRHCVFWGETWVRCFSIWPFSCLADCGLSSLQPFLRKSDDFHREDRVEFSGLGLELGSLLLSCAAAATRDGAYKTEELPVESCRALADPACNVQVILLFRSLSFNF